LRAEKSLEVEGVGVAAGFGRRAFRYQQHGGKFHPMREDGCTEGETPERDEPWKWLWDEISSQSRSAEQTVERLRKPVDGTQVGVWEPSQ